jgi:hypothetical protein
MDARTLAAALRRYGAAARCSHRMSQAKARRIWFEIAGALRPDERLTIGVALDHFRIGEGAEELDQEVGRVIGRLEQAAAA